MTIAGDNVQSLLPQIDVNDEVKRERKLVVPEKMKRLQEDISLKHCIINDIKHPKRNLAAEEAKLTADDNAVLNKEEPEVRKEQDDEILKRKVKGLAFNMMEKKRANVYRINKIQYPYKTPKQIERELENDQYTRKQKIVENLSPREREEVTNATSDGKFNDFFVLLASFRR